MSEKNAGESAGESAGDSEKKFLKLAEDANVFLIECLSNGLGVITVGDSSVPLSSFFSPDPVISSRHNTLAEGPTTRPFEPL